MSKNQEKREKIINAIYYYLKKNISQKEAVLTFGVSEHTFTNAWKKFKDENNLIVNGGYVTFRDMPKYPCTNEVKA